MINNNSKIKVMKNLKFKRNMWMIIGGTIIASIQSGLIMWKGIDMVNIISFFVIQYLYMDLVIATFNEKMEKVTNK